MGVILYSDVTHTAIRSSGIYYPIYLSIANIHESVRKKDYGRVLVGYLPQVFATTAKLATQSFRTMVRNLKHEALRILTEPLRRVETT